MLLGQLEVDLMAISKSHQVEVYFAALEYNEATALDALTEDKVAYIFPHPVMMELILNRIYQCSGNSRFIVIYPWKPRALWFPKLMKLAIQQPIRIPSSLSTVTDLAD